MLRSSDETNPEHLEIDGHARSGPSLVAASLALAATVVAAPIALLKRPDDVSNPDAAFDRSAGAGVKEAKKPKKKATVTWPRFGYDVGRSKFLDAPVVRPPFRKAWKYTGGDLIEFPPIVVGKRLYLIDNSGFYVALDAETGKVIWKKQLASLNASSPAYYKGILYSVSLEPQQAIAVRASDGKTMWKKPLPARAESSPLVVRGRMYFGDEAGSLYALDIKDGSTIWQTQLGGSVKAAPALEDGTLYVGDYGGQMNAVRASDGQIVWQTSDLGSGIAGSGRFYSTAAVAFGRVYAGDVDNRVYSFDAEDRRHRLDLLGRRLRLLRRSPRPTPRGRARPSTSAPTIATSTRSMRRAGKLKWSEARAGRSAARRPWSATSSTYRRSAATRRSGSTWHRQTRLQLRRR